MRKLILIMVMLFFISTISSPFANAESETPTSIANQYGYNVSDAYQPKGAANIS